MGGLLAADTLREFVKSSQGTALWPKIIACISYDTPVGVVILHLVVIYSFTSPR